MKYTVQCCSAKRLRSEKMSVRLPPPQALRFRTSVADKDEREARVSVYEAQGTMGRRQKTGEALFLFPPTFADKFFIDRETSGNKAVNETCSFLLTPPQGGTFPHDVITIVSKHFDKSLVHEVRFDQHP